MKFNSYTNNLKLRIFDIETTGFNSAKDTIIAASFCDENGDNLVQYFCDDPESEFLLLTKISDEFSLLDGIITYNGANFDIPFIMERANHYGLKIPKVYNIDIYILLKKYWLAGSILPSLKQKDVEIALGFDMDRVDQINGADCISCYNNYLSSGDLEYKKYILLHNEDDVKQLSKIANSLSFLPFHKINFEQGFLYKFGNNFLYFLPKKISDLKISISGSTIPGLKDVNIYNDYFNFDYDSKSGLFLLVIKPKELEDYLYIDLTKTNIDEKEFINSEAYVNSYLILCKKNNLMYNEINTLSISMVKRYIFEQL